MRIPTIRDFIFKCLEKSGHDVKTYDLSDNSSCGINIYKEREGEKFTIELEFTGDGLRMTDVNIFRIVEQEVDQIKVL